MVNDRQRVNRPEAQVLRESGDFRPEFAFTLCSQYAEMVGVQLERQP